MSSSETSSSEGNSSSNSQLSSSNNMTKSKAKPIAKQPQERNNINTESKIKTLINKIDFNDQTVVNVTLQTLTQRATKAEQEADHYKAIAMAYDKALKVSEWENKELKKEIKKLNKIINDITELEEITEKNNSVFI